MDKNKYILYGNKEVISKLLDEYELSIYGITLIGDSLEKIKEYNLIPFENLFTIDDVVLVVIDRNCDISYIIDKNINYKFYDEISNELFVSKNVNDVLIELNKLSVSFKQNIKEFKLKDESIYNLNKELQNYKNDFYNKLLNPCVIDAISFRENCKETANDLTKYDFDKLKIKKYYGYTKEEFENILYTYGVKTKDDKFYIEEDELIDNETNDDIINEKTTIDDTLITNKDNYTINDVYNTICGLKKYFDNAFLLDNKKDQVLDSFIKDRKKKNMEKVVINPFIRKLISLYDDIVKDGNDLLLVDDEKEIKGKYFDILKKIVDKLEDILYSFNVRLRFDLDGMFNPKYHKVIKMIPITKEEENKEKRIEKHITDCYMIDDKVIYQAKVNIYKIK